MRKEVRSAALAVTAGVISGMVAAPGEVFAGAMIAATITFIASMLLRSMLGE